MEVTDEMLVLDAQKGDQAAFGQIVERFQDKLLRYARKFLLNPDDAQDIVQDVFIKAYENLQSFDVSRRFSPWIYRIAHNEFVNDLKKKQSRKTTFTIDFDTLFPTLQATDTADSAALDRDTREMLNRSLSGLDVKYREALILYYLEEMSYREIADILHIPVSTVGVRIARGKAQLQKITAKDKAYDK